MTGGPNARTAEGRKAHHQSIKINSKLTDPKTNIRISKRNDKIKHRK
jgi:hypothetical protein